MAGYLIANYRITNPEGYQAYTAAVGSTILAHGGEILVAGPGSIPIEGNPDRLDLGIPPDDTDDSFQIYITVGPEF